MAFGSPSTVDPPIRAASLCLIAKSLQPIDIVAFIKELQVLLQKEPVETASQSPGFYNSFFLIQKVSGSWHPIIDFSLIDYVTSSLLHRDCIVSPLFLSLRRLDGLSGSTGAYMQDPLIMIRVVIFAFVEERTYQSGVYCVGLTPSHQVFMWIMAPISAILQSMDN